MLKPSLRRHSQRVLQRRNPEMHVTTGAHSDSTHHERIAYIQTTQMNESRIARVHLPAPT
jgi:hypothetical protein